MDGQLGKVLNLNDRIKVHLLPAQNVHVGMSPYGSCDLTEDLIRLDQSPATVIKRIKLQLGERSEHLLKGRVRVLKYADVHRKSIL